MLCCAVLCCVACGLVEMGGGWVGDRRAVVGGRWRDEEIYEERDEEICEEIDDEICEEIGERREERGGEM